MGWQLFPIGLGWRAFSTTMDQGEFICRNPACSGRATETQSYRMMKSRNWLTVLFIPVLPLNIQGVYVQCRTCKTVYPASALPRANGAQPTVSPGPVAGLAPPDPDSALDDRTVARQKVQAPAPSLTVRLDDGESFTIGSIAVIGRAPTAPATFPTATPHSIADPTLTVSKTHAVVGLDATGPWIVDLDAANGVVVDTISGVVRLEPGVRAPIGPADVVRIGDRTFTVEVLAPGEM